jgi:hypothetical protein
LIIEKRRHTQKEEKTNIRKHTQKENITEKIYIKDQLTELHQKG